MPVNISCNINGKAQRLDAELETSALELLRDQLGLTGAKLVCGSGACGACTILVDGAPRCSCLLPANHLEGRTIITVEGHAENGYHPVQSAFLAHDALQCGYCTPGFINAGIAFYNHWREKHGKSEPGRTEIAEGLAGNLCRCAAYDGIYRAIAAACKGDFDTNLNPAFARVDGPEKVKGTAKYTTDVKLPGQLVGMVFRSPHPHARVTRLDLSKAQSAKGVKAAISQVNPDNMLRYMGQPIAAIAAETAELARAAMKLIEIEFEILPFVQGIENARKAGAVLIYPDKDTQVPVASEGPPFPASWEGNVRKTSISFSASNAGKAARKVSEALPGSKNLFKARFETPHQFHTAFEPHCAVAWWKTETQLEVHASTQAVKWIGEELAKRYGLNETDVEVKAAYVGGAFGAKLGLTRDILTAIDLARVAKAPVSIVYSRAEELSDAGYRPSALIDFAITADADGLNPAYTLDAYASSGNAIGSNIADVSGLTYTGIDKALQDYDVVSNFSNASAFRGPGGPAACFVLEQGIDQLAYQIGMDPLEFRRKWEKDEGFLALFKWVEASPLWQSRTAMAIKSGRFSKGLGLAFGGWMHLYMPSAVVVVTADESGFSVSNAVQDMGQGSKSVLAAAVAEVFMVPAQEVRVIAGSSSLTLGPASGGSRTAASIFPAAKEAAGKVLEALKTALAKEKGMTVDAIVEGGIRSNGAFVPWKSALKGIATIEEKAERGRNAGFNPMGLLPLGQGLVLGQGRGYGCYVIEVEVDRLLGKVRVTQVEGAMRIGKVHVKANALSQCHGGIIQGIGHALYENSAICPSTGNILTRGLEDYRIPGIGDVPKMKVDFLEEGFEFVKEKGIGLAELCTVPVAGAIGNAIFNAVGWRPLRGPILPQDVLEGIKGA